MQDSGRDDAKAALEADVRRLCERGDFDGAATLTLRALGPETLGFLYATHRDEADARDAFSLFCERVWASLPAFEWRSRLRTWAYTLARRSSIDVHRAGATPRAREVRLQDSGAVENVAALVRSATATYLRTAVKDRVAQIREQLPPDDRQLLVLRVDRNLAWNEVAEIMLSQADDAPSPETLKREAARLRKRFELVKAKIVEIGKSEGLIGRG